MINAQELYKDINILSKSSVSNESKAHEIRKLFEKLLHSILDSDPDEKHTSLHDLINIYVQQEHKHDLQYISHELRNDLNYKLRKDLNTWAHHSNDKLKDSDLKDYFTRFSNLVKVITGEEDNIGDTKIKEFKLDDLGLNKKQKEAVLSTAKITLVNAGPGTGKTYLIVGRVLEELRKAPDTKIFGLSFTNKASEALQKKIDEKISTTNLFGHRNHISTGTMHSFSLILIQQYYEFRERVFDFIIVDETDLKDIQDELVNNEEEVEKYLTENKMLTFDMIINLFINTIKNNDGFKKFVSEKLDQIIVDEAQDLDKEQYKILSLLYQNNKNLKLFFVGDQRQNIYAFKGGSLNNIYEYFSDGKDLYTVELEHSYRCPQSILSLVNALNFNDCSNIALNNAAGIKGNRLSIKEYANKEDEAMAIAKLIKNKKDEDVPLSDISIIFPSTFYFKDILEALNAYAIAFKVFGGQYVINPDIRLLRLILSLIYTNNSYAFKAIQTLMISENLEGQNMQDVMNQLAGMDPSIYRSHRNLYHILMFTKDKQNIKPTPLEVVTNFIDFANKDKIFNEKVLDLFYSFKQIIENDLTLDDYDKLKLAFTPTHPAFTQFYSRSDEIVPSEYYEEGKEYVTVTTIHSAKGLQWDNVIIPGMSQESFPKWFKDKDAKEKEFPDEVKKFYVACTRSKQNLYFTRPEEMQVYSKKWNKYYTFKKSISEFVARLK